MFSLKFVRTVFDEAFFVGMVFHEVVFITSITSSQVITESLIILLKYLPFSQIQEVGFQI